MFVNKLKLVGLLVSDLGLYFTKIKNICSCSDIPQRGFGPDRPGPPRGMVYTALNHYTERARYFTVILHKIYLFVTSCFLK